VPKRVDPQQRRQVIAEAVCQVIAEYGWEAVTLRDVASTAGISMGQVQHYFTTKADMLMFALNHMRDQVLARLERELAALPQPVSWRDEIRATVRVMLPTDEPSRQEWAVNVAFFSAATVTPEYARLLREGYASQVAYSTVRLTQAAADGLLNDDIDPVREAAALYYLFQGLAGPVLIGQLTEQEAMATIDHQLARIFRP
jgi:AcrR family transcriptional regulator